MLFLTGFEIKPSICSSRFNLSKHEGSPVVMRRWIYANAGIFATKSKSQVGYYNSKKNDKMLLLMSVVFGSLADALGYLGNFDCRRSKKYKFSKFCSIVK